MFNQEMQNFLYKRFLSTPKREAFYYEGKSYTFEQVYQEAYDWAGVLSAQGVKQSQFVGVLLKNNLQSVFILFACQLLGVKAVILNSRLTSKEIVWQLNDSGAVFFLTETAFDKVRTDVEMELPSLQLLVKETMRGNDSYEQPEIVKEVNLEDICTIMYTSGTTGHPKGVIQTYGNHLWSAVGSSLNLGLRNDDVWLCTVPLFHISGFSILMRGLIYGHKIVLLPSFDSEKTIALIREQKVTIMSAVSTMLKKMLEQLQDARLHDSFRCLLLGGGPASRTLLEDSVACGIPVYQTYGMTETSSQIVTLSPEDSINKLGSAGKALFPSQVKICRENGSEADADESGEIFVKGPNVTKGYLGRDDATADKIIHGWLATGDIGFLDKEGFLYVLDRRSDLIISGGENVYPAEIEGVVAAHPAVADTGVIGMKDSTWGEVPVAFVVIKKDAEVSHKELEDFCVNNLAKYKIPKRFFIVDAIPRNAAKKILRRELRKMVQLF